MVKLSDNFFLSHKKAVTFYTILGWVAFFATEYERGLTASAITRSGTTESDITEKAQLFHVYAYDEGRERPND
jgi:hypothetical protein